MQKHYISNKDESARMFKTAWLEKLTHVHPAAPHVVFVPYLCWLLHLNHGNDLSRASSGGLFLCGLLLWTFLEYVLHRFMFHFRATGSWQKWAYFVIHGVHHDYPRDSRRLVMPPLLSIPMAIPFFFLYKAVFGTLYFPVILAGSAFGYLMYDTTHFAVHHFRPRTKLGVYVKQQHMRHHYVDPDKNFGVTSPLWDIVFGTFLKQSARTEQIEASGDYALLHQ